MAIRIYTTNASAPPRAVPIVNFVDLTVNFVDLTVDFVDLKLPKRLELKGN